MSGLAGGLPTAWEYAAARRACKFRRLHESNAKPGEPTIYEECGLCGQAWVVGWRWLFRGRERHEVSAAEVWTLVYEHCADHAVGLVA